MSNCITPFSLKDAPALIERLLPVQKLSAEVFKERKAGAGQTLTPLGAYWKGRKPLILGKACVLAASCQRQTTPSATSKSSSSSWPWTTNLLSLVGRADIAPRRFLPS
jgi:hypothetical protein